MRRALSRLAALSLMCLAATGTSGCVNLGLHYSGLSKEQVAQRYGRSTAPAQVVHSTIEQQGEMLDRLWEDGFAFVGHSSFEGPAVNDREVISFANDLGVDVAVLATRFSRTVSGALPMATPTTSTTTSTFSGSTYGRGGYGTFQGTGTSTTYGSATTWVPYSVDRYSQTVGFFRKLTRPPVVGFRLVRPSDEERSRAGTNQVARVSAVMRGTPAFYADILRGDLLLKFGDTQVSDPNGLGPVVQRYAGLEVEMLLMRGSERIAKRLRLNPAAQ